MKQIVLTLTLLLTFGLSYGTNPNELKINDTDSSNEELIVTTDYSNCINLSETTTNTKESTVTTFIPQICVEIGAAVFIAAHEAGHPGNRAIALGIAATEACRYLLVLGVALNN